jgi:ankyrin repeat protein
LAQLSIWLKFNFVQENGAKIEAQDSGQWTPLLWACYRGHIAVADCLISRGANINARGMYQGKGLFTYVHT